MGTPSRKIADCIVESMSSRQLQTLQTAIAEQIDKRSPRRGPVDTATELADSLPNVTQEEITPHYREENSSESEAPPVTPDPATEAPSTGALS